MTDLTASDVLLAADDIGSAVEERRQALQRAQRDALLRSVMTPPAPGPDAPARPAGGALGMVEAPADPTGGAGDKGGLSARKVVTTAADMAAAVPAGILAGAKEAAKTIDGMAEWLNSHVADLKIPVPSSGNETLDRLGAAALNPVKAVAEHGPEMPPPDTAAGGLVKSVAQFLTGYAVGGKALSGVKAAGAVAGAAKGLAQGAIADAAFFAAQDQNLSDLVEANPALSNPVTQLLAIDPADPDWMNRGRRAIEGAGLGMATDALLGTVRTLAQWRRARAAGAGQPGGLDDAAIQARAETMRADAAKRDWLILGDPEKPLVETRTVEAPADAVRAELRKGDAAAAFGEHRVQAERLAEPAPRPGDAQVAPGEGGGTGAPADAAPGAPQPPATPTQPKVEINFSRIDGPEDVKNVLQQMAEMNAGDLEAARRGVRTHADTAAAAGKEDAWQLLMQMRAANAPSALNAEQSLAVRQLWTASADKLAEVAKLAASAPSEGNLFAFRKMLATHTLVQEQAIAARTETARALESWKIPAGGGREQLRAIESVLRDTGGQDFTRQMAERIAALADAGMAPELDAVARGSVAARTWGGFLQVWINGLLSGPKTHVVNMLSNSSVLAAQLGERAVAARLSRLLGSDAGVEIGETMAQIEGLKGAYRDAFVNAAKALRTGKTGYGLGKMEAGRPGALSAQTLGIADNSIPGALFNGLDVLTSVPSRLLGAEDEVFKTLGYRMQLHAEAYRRATQEARRGGFGADWIAQRRADLLANPPEDLKLSAVDQALYQTFTAPPGPGVQKLMGLLKEWPIARILVPFVNTPANILKYAAERSPVAPLLGEWRADIAAGGARRHMAMTRTALGTGALLTAIDLAQQGNMTGGGPVDPAQREAFARDGKKPYAVKFGDRWFQYNRLDPLGMTLGIAADINELLLNGDLEKDGVDTERALVAAVAAVGNNTMSKTYLSGLADFFEAMSDPKRYGQSYVQRLVASVVPAGVAEVARAIDPYLTAAGGMVDALKARTPWLSEDVPFQRDLWGRPIGYQSGIGALYDAVSPIYSSKENPEPIDVELKRIGGWMPSRPDRTVSFRLEKNAPSVTVDLRSRPELWTRYVELAGNEAKLPLVGDLGAKDFLNRLVTGKHELAPGYAQLSDDGKERYLRQVIDAYRELARDQLLKENPDLRAEVRTRADQMLHERAGR